MANLPGFAPVGGGADFGPKSNTSAAFSKHVATESVKRRSAREITCRRYNRIA